MTASHFWIGVECMPASVVQDAASHPRPILCGNLADAADMRSALAKSLEQAEWHDLRWRHRLVRAICWICSGSEARSSISCWRYLLSLVLALRRATMRRALWMMCCQRPDMRSRV